MIPAKPSPSVLREMSDEAVLRALMGEPLMTRAEIAVATRLSKPTAAESIRRLESAGLVHDTGQRTSGRGGIGSYYALAANVGVALAISIAPEGIVVERVDPTGAVTARHVEPIGRPATQRTVTRLLTNAARTTLTGVDASTVRVAVVSAADPVDRTTGALVHLPDAPFLLGRLTPARTLAAIVNAPVLVDNDVNWEARAEHDARTAPTGAGPDDFVYLHLGEGLGLAVVADGQVRRGHSGLAGEISHLTTTGPDGQPMPFTAVFNELGLRLPDSTAVDTDALLAAATDTRTARILATAIGDVITAAIGLCDPQLVVLGGEWGTADPVVEALRARLADAPRTVPLDTALATGNSALAGARAAAIRQLQTDIVTRSKDS